MSLLRLCALALTAVALSSCGTAGPGAAATVDGESISMSALDETARVYCEVTVRQAEQQQGVTAIDNADMRRQAVIDLVLARVAKDIADERDLTIPTPVDLEPDQFVEAFGAKRAPAVAEALANAQDLFKLLVVIGGDEAAVTATAANSADLAEVGRDLAVTAFPEHDVTFAPRLGLSDSGETNGDIGSLSLAPADLEAPTPDELPGPLACRV